jgi:nucleotide-binding universal stress UspA family protein
MRRARLDQAVGVLPFRVDADGQIIDGDPAEVLAAESKRLDLLAIGSRGYGALRATLVGSVGHELAGTSHCPLLLVPRGVARPLDGLVRRRGHRKAAH